VKLLLVDDFEGGQQNKLGGFHPKYQAGDSVAVIARDANVRRGKSGSSLSVQTDRRVAGYCGVWPQFFYFRAPQRRYFDPRPFGYLSFWVKGQVGGEQFTVKLADGKWIEKDDSLPVGDIRRFLPKGVTNQWQEVLIPLAALKGLDIQYLGGLTLDFTSPGRHAVWIDDISFKTAATTTPRAMWLWESNAVLNDAASREELFTFCRNESIEQLWMQLDCKVVRGSPQEAEITLQPTDADPASSRPTTTTAAPTATSAKSQAVERVTCEFPDRRCVAAVPRGRLSGTHPGSCARWLSRVRPQAAAWRAAAGCGRCGDRLQPRVAR